MPAPYLRRVWLDPARITNRKVYPFTLPLLHDDFELAFDKAITIIVGENGTGKSTLLEGIAVMAGYDDAGGGKCYRPVDHCRALEFLKLLQRMNGTTHCQVILATHLPVLMAYPDAALLRLTKGGLEPASLKNTDHYRLMRQFCEDPESFVEEALTEATE
jgi:predicted ATPase